MTSTGAESTNLARSSGSSRRLPEHLVDAFMDRNNALGTMRVLLALAVVASHSFLVLGVHTEHTQVIGAWAVNGFFALSGYLITGSRLRLSFGRYLWHRALRLFPAYWAVLIAVAFVFAPLAVLVTGERWDTVSALGYVVKNFGLWVLQPGVSETLRSVPYALEWNAPLWTLVYEAVAYLVAGVALSFAFVKRRPAAWLSVGLVALMAALLFVYGPASGAVPEALLHALRLGSFFVSGMLLYALRSVVSLRWWFLASCVSGLGVLHYFGVAGWLGQPLFAYCLLWLSARLPWRIGIRNDLSYGIYIWAFPVQQLFVVLGVAHALGVAASFVLAIATTLPLAWMSWRCIERPALAWKDFARYHADSELPR